MAVPASVSRWSDAVAHAAAVEGLDPRLVLAVVWQESAGNPFAVRPEPGFWRRYADGIQRLISSTTDKDDDRWSRYPDLASASYGLMQVLYIVALERGERLRYPTELCDVDRNLRVGCAHLARKLRAAGGDVRAGLLGWNGGGNPAYPDEVLRKREEVGGR